MRMRWWRSERHALGGRHDMAHAYVGSPRDVGLGDGRDQLQVSERLEEHDAGDRAHKAAPPAVHRHARALVFSAASEMRGDCGSRL